MKPYAERLAEAQGAYAAGLAKVANTPEPEGQKFPVGSRVQIADDLGPAMSHFRGRGKKATVLYTYAHAYGGGGTVRDLKQYSLHIDGMGSSSWYDEEQLTAIED